MLTSEEIAQLLAALVPAIWSNGQRTLTHPSASISTPAGAEPIVLYRNGTIDFAISDCGSLVEAVEIWFTIKNNLDAADDDALLQISKVNGLTRLNGQTPTAPAQGTLIIQGLPADGTILIHLDAAAAALLPIFNPTLNTPPYDVKVRYSNTDVYPIKTGHTHILTSATASLEVLT